MLAPITPPPIVQLAGAVSEGTVQLGLTLNKESRPQARSITWTLPRGVRVSAAGFPRCGPARAARRACPPGSLVGTGRMSTVTAGRERPRVFELGVHADGPRRLTFALRGPGPDARRHVVVRRQRLRLRIPPTMRRGLYLTNFKLALGPAIHRGRSLVRAGCPERGYEYAVEIGLLESIASATAESGCR